MDLSGDRAKAVEQESGIGGEMVRTKAKQASKAHRRNANEPSTDRAARVNKKACRKLSFDSDRIMARVALKVLNGDTKSLRELQREAKVDSQYRVLETKSGGVSQAALWGAEPEWTGESSEELAETRA